jgi:hypothetical protein
MMRKLPFGPEMAGYRICGGTGPFKEPQEQNFKGWAIALVRWSGFPTPLASAKKSLICRTAIPFAREAD